MRKNMSSAYIILFLYLSGIFLRRRGVTMGDPPEIETRTLLLLT